jgi:hypothetical protein
MLKNCSGGFSCLGTCRRSTRAAPQERTRRNTPRSWAQSRLASACLVFKKNLYFEVVGPDTVWFGRTPLQIGPERLPL